jgi:predicted lipid-binding transport protein (Tim44 family)
LVVSVLLAIGLLGWQLARRAPSFAHGLAQRGFRSSRSARSSLTTSEYEAASLAPESTVHYAPGVLEQSPSGASAFRWGAPAGFDSDGFLRQALHHFVVLQQAWDAADIPRLSDLMTDELLANIQLQLQERGDRPNRTDVVTLDAELLGVESVGEHYVASVEFSGMIREEVSAGATPFRELWNLTKPQDGSSGWLLAGVQALH